MCFVTDCNWCAEVSEDWTEPATEPIRCDECCRQIAVGEAVRRIHQHEHEWCHACDEGECECPKDEDGECTSCRCEEPQHGEEFDYECCAECQKFRTAVVAAEIEAGCSQNEASPHLGMMFEEIGEAGRDEARKYWKTAAKMFPEMRGWLAARWRKMFAHDRAAAK